jgi:hypothetical protein
VDAHANGHQHALRAGSSSIRRRLRNTNGLADSDPDAEQDTHAHRHEHALRTGPSSVLPSSRLRLCNAHAHRHQDGDEYPHRHPDFYQHVNANAWRERLLPVWIYVWPAADSRLVSRRVHVRSKRSLPRRDLRDTHADEHPEHNTDGNADGDVNRNALYLLVLNQRCAGSDVLCQWTALPTAV